MDVSIWWYSRVSTPDQNTTDQDKRLREAGAVQVFSDVASGATSSRPGLDQLLSVAQPGNTVMVCRLDRLGRSMLHMLGLIERFRNDGVAFRSLDDGIDGDSPAGRLMIGLLASIAEYERTLVQERTMAGLRTARAAGRKGGRPRALTGERLERVQSMMRRGLTAPEIGRVLGVSRTTAYAYVRQLKDSVL